MPKITDSKVKASVLIPTLNGEKYLRRLLPALKLQTLKPVQVLVVDSTSTDDTVGVCKSFGIEVIQIERKTFDHGGTRNLAASKATGETLVYLTQDAMLTDAGCLKRLLKPLEDPQVAASYGRHVPDESANPVEVFDRSFNYPPTGTMKDRDDLPKLGVRAFFFSNVCSAIKVSAFKEVGGFPCNTIRNEDMFLAAKLLQEGYKIAYEPDAVVRHSHNHSFVVQFNRNFDIGVFFSRNPWIKAMARTEREGVENLKAKLRHLAANRQWGWIPYALSDVMIRFLGYKAGLWEKQIPRSIKKKISHNKVFWEVGD